MPDWLNSCETTVTLFYAEKISATPSSLHQDEKIGLQNNLMPFTVKAGHNINGISMNNCLKLLLVLPFISTPLSAVAALSNFAISADVGASRQSAEQESGQAASFAVGLSYQINPVWSVVLNYTDSGEADMMTFSDTLPGDDVLYEASLSLDTSAVGLFAQYLTERQTGHWSLGGRLGLARWDSDMNVTLHASPDISLTAFTDSGTNLAAGLLAQYGLTYNWDLTLGLDYLRHDISIEGGSTALTNTRLYLGLKNSF